MKKWLEKAEKSLFYLLVFAIPIGTRKVLYEWPQPASPAGRFFNEWESISFWFTDGLLLLLILVWLLNGGSIRFKNAAWGVVWQRLYHLPLAVFFLFAGFSVSAADNLGLAFYQWLRLGAMILFFIYVRERISSFNFKKIAGVFIASAVFQGFLAVGQAMMQKNLGLWFLGESVLNPGMINVAKFVSQSTKILRSYGTLPHPNVLAAFLATAIFFLLYWYFFVRNAGSRRQILIFIPVYFVLLFALFLTFSRGITLIFLAVLAGWFFWLLAKDKKKFGSRIIYAFLALAITYSLLGAVFYRKEVVDRYWTTFSYKEEAVSFRMFYNEQAFKMIVKNPALGVGIGNSAARLDEFLTKPLQPWLYQPVHNIFLLTGAEIGLFGLAAFIWLLFSLSKKIWLKTLKARSVLAENSLFLAVFSAFMLFGLFDHFFLTLQPAKLLFWFILGMLGSRNSIGLPKTVKNR